MEISEQNERADRDEVRYPAFASPSAVFGVRFAPNPDMDAPQKHARLNPNVSVRTLDGQTVTLLLTPGHDNTPQVTFSGGPRRWWDADAAITEPTVPLQALQSVVSAATPDTMVAASIEETWGTREVTVATVLRRPRRFSKPRRYFSITVGGRRDEGMVTWPSPDSTRFSFRHVATALVDQSALAAALRALTAVAGIVELVDVSYASFRQTG